MNTTNPKFYKKRQLMLDGAVQKILDFGLKCSTLDASLKRTAARDSQIYYWAHDRWWGQWKVMLHDSNTG